MHFAYRDLHQVREKCRTFFSQWDEAINKGDTVRADAIRKRELWPAVRNLLSFDADHLPGIYIFADATKQGWDRVRYIGRTEASLRARLEAYIKHDSCWDASLIGMPQEAVHEIMWGRVRPIMPSTDLKLRDYQEQHYDACRKLGGGSLYVAGFDHAEVQLIRSVEAGLITLAWANGAPLENQRSEKLPAIGDRSAVLSQIIALADGWEGEGMPADLVEAIREGASRAASN